MPAPNTPIIIGVGQVTEKDPDLSMASSPLDLMEQATWRAAESAGLPKHALQQLSTVVVVRSFREPARNSPESLANRVGAQNAEHWLTPDGGNAPQYLVNSYAEAITRGEHSFVLLTGSEAMATGRKIVKSGGKPDWQEPASKDAQMLYPDKAMWTEHEHKHGIWQASHVYPLFENALRHHYGHTIAEHQKILGELFAPFSEVAAQSPYAWYPIKRSATEIATATRDNRYVGWPYTKYMNAMNQVNQSASVLLTSVEKAKKSGIDPSRWVYLHGCADADDIWPLTSRIDYHSSPAIRIMGQRALAMAKLDIDDIDFMDLYSCFPSAVQIARDELGIAQSDPRSLTITGGLPFHGGAGNNYVMNSIAAMVDKVREYPGKFGLVTANGGMLAKHAAGIYSTSSMAGEWRREDPAVYQHQIEVAPHPICVEDPQGAAILETYSVVFGRSGEPERAIIVGRLGDDLLGPRFIANTPADQMLWHAMTRENFIGRRGRVSKQDGLNIFQPDG